MSEAGLRNATIAGFERDGDDAGAFPEQRGGRDVIAPQLTVACRDGAARLAAWLSEPKMGAAGFGAWLRRQEDGLARGFDRLLALEELDLQLFEHQKHAVLRVLRDMRGRALLADDVGLGKTIEAGVIAKEYMVRGLAERMLVLTPASLTIQWRAELQDKIALPCHVFAPGDDWAEHPLLIASLDTARRPEHAARVLSLPWDIVIVDEAHRLKNRHTQSWRLVDRLQKKYMLLLTATPIQNDLEELYNMMTLLQPGLLETYRAFKRQFVAERRAAKHTARLRARIAQAMVRTTRASAGLEQSRRRVHTVFVPLEPEERAFYDDVLAFARNVFASPQGEGQGNWLPLLLLLRQLCSSPDAAARSLQKMSASSDWTDHIRRTAAGLAARAEALTGRFSKLTALVRWLEGINEPCVVFTQFRATQEALVARLSRKRVPTVLFHGGMDRDEKEAAVRRFRREGGVFISTEAGSEGQNLQFCRIVVNCDLPWNPMRVEQRIGRVHRLGQTRDVLVVNVLAPDTMEMHVHRLLQQKIKLFEQVIGDLDVILAPEEGAESVAGAAFERTFGKALLEAKDDVDAARRVEALGRDAAAKMERLAAVRRRNEQLLPEEPAFKTPAEDGAGTKGRRCGPSAAPVATDFLHPLCLDPAFARDVLGRRTGRDAHGAARALEKRLASFRFVGGKARPAGRRIVHHRHWLFCFRIAYRTDETRETLHTVIVDPMTEEARFLPLPDDFVPISLEDVVGRGLRRSGTGGRSTQAATTPSSYVMRRMYDAAEAFMRRFVHGEEGKERMKEAKARLERDRRRLDDFYAGLEEEAMLPVVQRLRRLEAARKRDVWLRFVASDAEDKDDGRNGDELEGLRKELEAAADKLAAERRRRLEELAVKYSVHADVELVGAAQIVVPRVELTFRLLHPVRRDVAFCWDPVQDEFIDAACERCDGMLQRVHPTSDGDLLCAPCAGTGGEGDDEKRRLARL